MEKRAVRAAVLAARRAMPRSARDSSDQALALAAAALAAGEPSVAAYAPLPGEPGGDYLLPRLHATASAVLLPVLRPDRDLDWAHYQGELTPPAQAGVRVPPGAILPTDAFAEVRLVLVPALSVDQRGARLGRGGGSYDRVLRRVRSDALIVALVYQHELVDTLPAEPHDVLVNRVLTPAGLVTVPR